MLTSHELSCVCRDDYFPLNVKITAPNTVRQYGFALDDLNECLGRTAVITDLTDDNLIRMTRYLLGRGLAPKTINERVGRIRTLWTWLAKRGELRTRPTAPKLQEPEPVPFAWSIDELRRQFVAAGEMPGKVGRIKAGDWWQALFSWVWCTGERKEATFLMEHRHVNHRSKIATLPASIRKQKKKTAIYPLWDEVCEKIKAIKQHERVFYWDRSNVSFYLHYDKLLQRAGLETGRDRKTHSLRVSYATWITVSGGDATKALLHDSPVTTKRHYIDSRHLPHDVPDLPRLG